MNPLAIFSAVDNAQPSQGSEMTADLWLAELECLNEITDAYFAFSDQVQDAQTRRVGESFEQVPGRN